MIRKLTIILLLFIALSLQAEINVLIIDFSGEHSTFYDPDSVLGIIMPIEAYDVAFERIISEPSTFNMNDALSIEFSSSIPSDLTAYNIIFLLTGWRGSHGLELSIDQRNTLNAFVLSHTIGHQKALIVEGNDYCYDYCDTSSAHYTWHSSSEIFASVLLADSEPAFDNLYGWPGSIAEGLEFEYPGYGLEGPGFSPDDIAIDGTSPYSEYATYLFDGGSKGPARGMQRRGYTSGPSGAAGATAVLPFVFGNLKDGRLLNTKAEFLYRIIDFATMPIADFDENYAGSVFVIDSTYNIGFTQFDAVYVSEVKMDYSTDAGETWINLFAIEPETDLDSWEWTVPERESDECILKLAVKDKTGNSYSKTNGPFSVSYDGIQENKLPISKSLQASPNPFNSALKINFEKSSSIAISNIKGQIIFEKELEQNSIIWKPSNLPSGIYTINAISSSNEISRQNVLYLK
ncbi:MAG: T9SS type A sorting domain-containing protein [Candidatus Zixiibacteriota bacterium]